jgi:hypothetical protein
MSAASGRTSSSSAVTCCPALGPLIAPAAQAAVAVVVVVVVVVFSASLRPYPERVMAAVRAAGPAVLPVEVPDAEAGKTI